MAMRSLNVTAPLGAARTLMSCAAGAGNQAWALGWNAAPPDAKSETFFERAVTGMPTG
jgi:hypothetical protein